VQLKANAMRDALLLIAHGSRQEEANADLHYVAEELRRSGEYIAVVASFLELAEPNIDDGGAKCVVAGAKCVVLLPYFLSAGVHVRRDLTAARDRLRARFPEVDFCLAEPLGRHPLLTRIVTERAQEASERRG
jgi:sirohydrochlorin ferrochelatase